MQEGLSEAKPITLDVSVAALEKAMGFADAQPVRRAANHRRQTKLRLNRSLLF